MDSVFVVLKFWVVVPSESCYGCLDRKVEGVSFLSYVRGNCFEDIAMLELSKVGVDMFGERNVICGRMDVVQNVPVEMCRGGWWVF